MDRVYMSPLTIFAVIALCATCFGHVGWSISRNERYLPRFPVHGRDAFV